LPKTINDAMATVALFHKADFEGPPPVSTSSDLLRLIDGLLSLASTDFTSRDLVPTFPATLTTIAFLRQQLAMV
jgi:hypothetical protein